MRCGQIRQIRLVLSNPASVLKSDLELSRNLVRGRLRAAFKPRPTCPYQKFHLNRKFEAAAGIDTEMGREVNRACDLNQRQSSVRLSRSHDFLSRVFRKRGTAAAQDWRTGNGTDQAARRS